VFETCHGRLVFGLCLRCFARNLPRMGMFRLDRLHATLCAAGKLPLLNWECKIQDDDDCQIVKKSNLSSRALQTGGNTHHILNQRGYIYPLPWILIESCQHEDATRNQVFRPDALFYALPFLSLCPSSKTFFLPHSYMSLSFYSPFKCIYI
jgi:hypothetical protein